MEQLNKLNLLKELRIFELQLVVQGLLKGIDSGNMSAETLERAREAAMEASL